MDGKTTHYQRSKEIILNWAKGYYEENKGRLKKQAKINTESYLMKRKKYK